MNESKRLARARAERLFLEAVERDRIAQALLKELVLLRCNNWIPDRIILRPPWGDPLRSSHAWADPEMRWRWQPPEAEDVYRKLDAARRERVKYLFECFFSSPPANLARIPRGPS